MDNKSCRAQGSVTDQISGERREGGVEGWREGWRDGGREGWRDGGMEGGGDGGRESGT